MVVALRGWGVEMPPHCLPESRSQALTGLAPHTPPPPQDAHSASPRPCTDLCELVFSFEPLHSGVQSGSHDKAWANVCFGSMQAGHPVSPSPALPLGPAGRVQGAGPCPNSGHVCTQPGVSRLSRQRGPRGTEGDTGEDTCVQNQGPRLGQGWLVQNWFNFAFSKDLSQGNETS